MSLIIVKKPYDQKGNTAYDLELGTWFTDSYGQVYLIALDDRDNERRVICLGDYCRPYIPNTDLQNIAVKHALMPGTILQIASCIPKSEGR